MRWWKIEKPPRWMFTLKVGSGGGWDEEMSPFQLKCCCSSTGEGSSWQFCPVVSDSRRWCSSPFPTHRASVCLQTILRGHVASVTRHGTPFTFPLRWSLFIYLHFCILHAFELLGWRELGQETGAHSVVWIRSYDCRSSDLATQRLQQFNLQRHHISITITIMNL